MGPMAATHNQQTCSYLMEILLPHEKIVCQNVLLLYRIQLILRKHHFQFRLTFTHTTCCSDMMSPRIQGALTHLIFFFLLPMRGCHAIIIPILLTFLRFSFSILMVVLYLFLYAVRSKHSLS